MGMALKNNNTGQEVYKKENSKSSFLLINDGKKYHAYIMTIIADDTYLKNDKSKLDHNSYSKRDADFTGVLLYFTPKGKFINSYQYKNGKAIQSAPKNQAASLQKQPVVGTSRILKRDLQICIDWYVNTYIDNVLVNIEYIGTTCDVITTLGNGPNGAGGIPGSGPSAGNDTGFLPPIMVSDPSIFGLNDSNAQILDGNFDNYLNYILSQNGSFSDPGDATVTVDGVTYQGQFTYIYDNTGALVATYFSPDSSSIQFQMGMEYNVGNEGPDTVVSVGDLLDLGWGTPSGYLSSSTTISYTQGPGGSGNANTNIIIDLEPDANIASIDPDEQWWDDNTLSFPKQTLPSYNTLLSNFPMNPTTLDEIPGPQVYQNVGGDVYNQYLASNNPNACALRLSVALNKSGVVIPNIPDQTFQGGDGKYYFLSSAKIYNFMIKTFGAPDILLSESDGGPNGSLFESKLVGKGIFIMKAKSPALFRAYGHATIYNGFGCVGGINHCYFGANGGVSRIGLWKLL